MGRKPSYPLSRIIALPKQISSRQKHSKQPHQQQEQERQEEQQKERKESKEQQLHRHVNDSNDKDSSSPLMEMESWRSRHPHEDDDEALLPVSLTTSKALSSSRDPPSRLSSSLSSSSSLCDDTEDEFSSLSLSSSSSRCRGRRTKRKSVRFGSCEVRAYEQVLGDHPCCTMGCPLTLGWEYTPCLTTSVDDYEHLHQLSSSQSGEDLRMTWEERREILKSVVSDVEVRRACRRLNRDRLATTTRRGRRANQNFFSTPVTPPPTPDNSEELTTTTVV